jgi:NhaA family Na+:H+ antiporter
MKKLIARKLARPIDAFRAFLDSSAAGGIILMVAAALALIVANSPLASTYADTLHAHIGPLPVLEWINDALMALFFLLVGLEIKKEVLTGQLATWSQRALPGIAAVGGMIVPALIFLALNAGATGHPKGWAIPSATDIAFALGVLSLLGPRVPASLRVFLTALAIIDDLGAVLIIAFFYTAGLKLMALGGAAVVLAGLIALNRTGVARLLPYLILGAVLWILTLMSGIHATLAGVALAFTIPLRVSTPAQAPLVRAEHALQPWVNFAIVPLFGFANAGVSFAGLSPAAFLDTVPLGVALGLFFGKQAGVFLFSATAIRAGWAKLPEHSSWLQLYGVALLCGIGFTMSLFIGLLAFPGDPVLQDETKLGVLLGSVVSALAGALVFWLVSRESRV